MQAQVKGLTNKIDEIYEQNNDVIAQVNINEVKVLVDEMKAAVNNPSQSTDEAVKIISKIKNKIVKKQQYLGFEMRVRADLGPKVHV